MANRLPSFAIGLLGSKVNSTCGGQRRHVRHNATLEKLLRLCCFIAVHPLSDPDTHLSPIVC